MTIRHMTDAEALAEIQRRSAEGRISESTHARRRMNERGALLRDVRAAIASAKTCACVELDEKWKLSGGVDTDGAELVVVAALTTDGTLIVTIF